MKSEPGPRRSRQIEPARPAQPLRPFALIPLLYFVPLKRGDRVTVVSRAPVEGELSTGLLDIQLRFADPSDVPVGESEVIIADGMEAVRGVRRVYPGRSRPPAVVVLRRPERVASSLRTLPRRLFGFPRSTLLGRKPTWDLLVEPGLQAPAALIRTAFRSTFPVEGAGLKLHLKRFGAFYLLTRDSVLVYSDDPLAAPIMVPGFGASADRDARHSITSIRVSNGRTLIVGIKARGETLFVRFPFSGKALTRVERNHRLTNTVLASGFRLAPEPLRLETEGLTPLAVERGLAGRIGRPPVAEARLSAALNAITLLHLTTSTFCGPLTEGLFQRLIEPRLTRIQERLGNAHVAGTRGFLQQGLLGRTVRLSACHGDFHMGNCLFSGATVTGIIDWDLGASEDLSILDVVNFCLRCGDRVPLPELARSPHLLGEHYEEYIGAAEVDPIDPAVILRLWHVDRVSKQIEYGYDSEGWLDSHARLDPLP